MLATAWAGFQIAHTRDFHSDFARLTTNGACKPINLLPQYWLERSRAEYPLLVLNVVALLISAFLTWRLVKVSSISSLLALAPVFIRVQLFGWQTFKRVGASMTINRVYKLVLVLSINLQLALFFMVATIGLWIDQLWNGQIAHLARLAHIYKPIFIVVLIVSAISSFLVPSIDRFYVLILALSSLVDDGNIPPVVCVKTWSN